MYHLEDSLAMSTEATENPTVTLNRLQNYARHLESKQKDSVEEHPNTALISSSSSHPSKLVYYCTNGVNNSLNTSHKPSRCYIELPHLRPRKKEKDNQTPSTHLSSTQALVTSTGFDGQKTQRVIDSAATHHMFSDKSLFTSLKKSSPFIVSTGDPTSNLLAEGVCSLARVIQRLYQDLKTLSRKPVKALISVGSLWHQRLGHPSNQVVKMLGLPPTSETCEVCLTGKSSLLPFSGSFDKTQHPLECVHLDVFTSFKTVMFLKTKSEEFDEFVKWKVFSEKFHKKRIKNGFIHIFSPTATPEHNGFAERANRTILDKARCLLIRSNLPRSYWAKVVNTATFLSNLIPTASRNNKSPFVLWVSNLPRLKRLRTFSCKTFIMVQRKDRDWKLATTSEEGILLGFENYNSSYQILQLQDKKVVVTRHALFIEDNFPSLDKGSDFTDCSRWVDTGDENDVFFDFNEDTIENSGSQNPPEDHHDNAIQESPSSAVEQTCENLTPNNPRKITALISMEEVDPLSYSSAVSGRKDSCHWIAVIAKELEMMKNLEVWDVVNLEPHHKVVGTTWVFKRKKSPLTQTEYKARLCAQGFAQTLGKDYSKTFPPTGRMHSLRTLIAFSVTNSLKFQQLDIRSAFLNAELEENVYLGIPQGLGFDKKKQCLKLKKGNLRPQTCSTLLVQ
ncbi:hypothetical protein O181_075456 [Austropuccinia psidii MF-1]|uniref:Integrase catalytic domain-containing protein n=1 Tax=Austropuccinia psidii MF-1 TaxID=1389203 RepID=A0A9Q3F8K4_9BASI|nr:hypothetical protein [Austropuccinia psidii MF-1]